MHIDDFAPNLSFFFGNGMDPDTVVGRVARRIWAVAMKEKYVANERSQKLKYHIQTREGAELLPRRGLGFQAPIKLKRLNAIARAAIAQNHKH